NGFQVLEELGVDGHHIFEMAMHRAVLHHEDFAVAIDNLRFDFARLVIVQNVDGRLPVEDLLPDFGNAARAERIRGARPAQRRLHLFPALEERLIAPRRNKSGISLDLIDLVEGYPRRSGGYGKSFLCVFNRLMHLAVDSSCCPASLYPIPAFKLEVRLSKV